MLKYYLFIILLVVGSMALAAPAAENYQQLPGLIDIRSTFSDGGHDIKFIAKLAEERGFDVLFVNDHDRMALEYGLFPLRNLIRKRVEKASINVLGAEKYISAIEQINRDYHDLLILPGVESAPFYYWSGNPFKEGLTAHDWERHLLVMGLDSAEEYTTLPDIHNDYPVSGSNDYRFVVLLIWGAVAVLGVIISRWRGIFTYIGLFLLVSAVLLAINASPFFAHPPYDQYHGPQGVTPYQALIDDVNQKGGLSFWNHVETASGYRKMHPIEVSTEPHPQVLEETKDYTGFAAIYGDNITITEPGDLWDQLLLQYCDGKRNKPIWGISIADYHAEGQGDGELGYYQTTFLVRKRSRQAVLEALRGGKYYASRGLSTKRAILEEFTVSDFVTGVSGVMGDEIRVAGMVKIKFAIRTKDDQVQKIMVRLVRGGTLIKTFQGQTPFVKEYKDELPSQARKTFYRLEVTGPIGKIIANPIFVHKKSP